MVSNGVAEPLRSALDFSKPLWCSLALVLRSDSACGLEDSDFSSNTTLALGHDFDSFDHLELAAVFVLLRTVFSVAISN